MSIVVRTSTSAAVRLAEAARWLRSQGAARELVIVAATHEAAADLARDVAAELGGAFGWHRTTLVQLAAVLAQRARAERGLTPVGGLAVEAVCARVVHRAHREGRLERLAPIAELPGLPRALARTLAELRMVRADAASIVDGDLTRALADYTAEMERSSLCNRADLLALAAGAIARQEPADLVGKPILFVDVPVRTALERDLVGALLQASGDGLVLFPEGDERTRTSVEALGHCAERLAATGPVHAMQEQLFSERADLAGAPSALSIFSAPGESRECVELARACREEAERGVPFDAMAVVLRNPTLYRAHVEEAMRRAGIPVHFARGSSRPDPAGRALLALLSCKVEDLSATRFAEYLSLGELPAASADGAPPPEAPVEARRVPPPDEALPRTVERDTEQAAEEATPAAEAGDNAVTAGTLRTPRHWERLLVEAAVIKRSDRYKRRLDGLEKELRLALEEPKTEEALARRIQGDLDALDSLRNFALPLLAALEALPEQATWEEWIDTLGALATRALRRPERVLAVLAELNPMGEVGPVELREVRLVLERRLGELTVRPAGRRYGRLFVGTPDEVRGMAFEVVFVPGLAERVFPQKVVEDPVLPDAARERVEAASPLPVNADRAIEERLALRLALGAARRRVVASYPRLDLEQGRPRTPSFYALEVVRAQEGALPGFDELARKSSEASQARIGWPAPEEASQAIDEAEYDLAILERLLRMPAGLSAGAARYLLFANPHLGRALRFRAQRWAVKKWWRADGLVDPAPRALAALAEHGLTKRSFSPTALQNYAACPYRFLLQAVFRLAPREEKAELEELNPLQRGTIMHETQFETLVALREAKLLPVTARNMPQARAILDAAAASVAARFADELAPAIPRVWEDGIGQIKADLAEWLRRMPEDPDWVPSHFELSFGLKQKRSQEDEGSQEAPAALDCGIQLRGSIDLVERSTTGRLRATDFKSGKVRATDETVIGGGRTLQPVLYALALEKIFPGTVVEEGRLYYCTSVGEYRSYAVPLRDNPDAREAADMVASTVRGAIDKGFLPAAPAERECTYCDYQSVCGPYEEQRTARKPKGPLLPLRRLRERA